MASFQAKISWEMLRKSENKNKNRSDEFLLDPGQIIPKKIAKKFKKLKKKTIMASFQAKISWERPRKSENKKKIVPTSTNPTQDREIQKNSKKIQKIKQQDYGLFSNQNWLGMAEKERK